jgi:hypothetical protein
MTTTESSQFTIQRLVRCADEKLHGLAELLIDCVDGGASVSFICRTGACATQRISIGSWGRRRRRHARRNRYQPLVVSLGLCQ